MKNFVITSDSTCDLNATQVKENDIHIRPLTIILGGKEYSDNVTINTDKVLEYVEQGGDLPKTAAVSIEEYKEYFSQFTDKGLEVLHFCISEEVSSCYAHAERASQELKGVYVINSKQLSSGQGLLILKAIDMLNAGKTVKETYEAILPLCNKVNTSFLVDKLDFLHKGGRCSLASLLGAKMLKIHPFIAMDGGKLKVKKKYNGNLMACYTKYVRDLADMYPSYDKTRCFITHCKADQAIIDMVKEKVTELFEFEEINVSDSGTTVSCHCGRNTLGVLFITD